MKCCCIFISFYILTLLSCASCLYPIESLTREIKPLDGVWLFKICSQDDQEIGFRHQWNKISLGDVRKSFDFVIITLVII